MSQAHTQDGKTQGAPINDNLFFTGISTIVLAAMAMGFVLIAWVVGGTAYKDVIGGNIAFFICIIAMAVGGFLTHKARQP